MHRGEHLPCGDRERLRGGAWRRPAAQDCNGLPLYGYDYPADSDKIGAKALGTGTAVLYSAARKQVTNRRYEPVSQTPWYVYTDAKSVIHQVFYEDEESIGKKSIFIVEQKLGGVGFGRSATKTTACGWWSKTSSL